MFLYFLIVEEVCRALRLPAHEFMPLSVYGFELAFVVGRPGQMCIAHGLISKISYPTKILMS